MRRLFTLSASASFYVLFILFSSLTVLEGQVVINEVCSSNSSRLADPDYGKYGDWIELYHSGDGWLDISGWFLSDDSTDQQKWQLPAETFIGPKGYKVIFADGRATKLHANFNLNKQGEFLSLCDTASNLIDSLSFPYLLNDMSFGRIAENPQLRSVFVNPTPGALNLGSEPVRIASFVHFSISGGFYSGTQKLALSYPDPAKTIYYTSDGSYPTKSSKVYTDTLVLSKTSVIRAICFEPGTITGIPLTHTYFIDEVQNLPVFSLVTDSVNLFSDESGIMVKGTAGVSGYCTSVAHNLNMDWERPVNLEFFEDDGSQVMNQMCGTKIFGGCSRIRYPEKSLAFFARSNYETSSFSHQLFPDKNAVEYETFILRASGDDQPKTMFRDALTQTLVKDEIDVDVQGYRPVVLYINGAYWGIINMREKLNEHYVENNYGVDSDKADVLRRNPESTWNVIAGSADHYNAMMAYIQANDMTQSSNYEYVSTQMDMDEYINYQVIQIFFGGRDWPGNNIKFWRSSEEPYTKWRWILYDLDAHSIDAVGNIMEEATEVDCECGWPNPPWSTLLFRTLLENEVFAEKFIERFNTYVNTVFARDRYMATINEMQNHLAPEIPRHIERWGGQKVDDPDNTWMSPVFNSFEEWESNIQVMRDFVELRHEIAVQQLNDYFGIEGTRRLILHNTDTSGAVLMIGETPFYNSDFSGNYSSGTKVRIEASPSEGFILSHWDKVAYSSVDTVWISKGDRWKYYDKGGYPDEFWKELNFDDFSWQEGNAEFGYGDGDETTLIDYGPDPGNKYISTYFRKIVNISDIEEIELFELQIKRDDACVVFVNGKQVIKENMPQYGHDYSTLAVSAIGGEDENKYLLYNLNPELFIQGENIIAVEIHQAGGGSSDVSFDMQLISSSLIAGETEIIKSKGVQIEMLGNIGLRAHIIPDTIIVNNVFINEVVSNNGSGISDEFGELEDWIEFYNAGREAVDMAGLFLSDTIPASKIWKFPTGQSKHTKIEAGGHLIIFADNETGEGPLHANFRLSSDGEELMLMQKVGHDTLIVDQLNYAEQYKDIAYGRYPDGSASLYWMQRNTPGESNVWEALSSDLREKVFINEIVASNIDKYADEAGDFDDWIEIYNAGSEAVNLAGLYLTDSLPVAKSWQFPLNMPSLTTVLPDSFIVVFADDEKEEGPLHANFRLSGDGEEVVLLHILATDTTILDHVVFGDQYNNVAWGRYPDGAEEFKFLPVNTPGRSNFWEALDTTSVRELFAEEFVIYPNPTRSLIYIDVRGSAYDEEIELAVYSFTGRQILNERHDGSERISISLEPFPAGIYLVELQMGGQRYVRKVVKE